MILYFIYLTRTRQNLAWTVGSGLRVIFTGVVSPWPVMRWDSIQVFRSPVASMATVAPCGARISRVSDPSADGGWRAILGGVFTVPPPL